MILLSDNKSVQKNLFLLAWIFTEPEQKRLHEFFLKRRIFSQQQVFHMYERSIKEVFVVLFSFPKKGPA
jgi:hypothetical protein